MKTIGLIGGMSWESSAAYYRLMNQDVAFRLGGNHSAKLILSSADFQQFVDWQHSADWPAIEAEVQRMADGLVAAGADAIVIACNTQHEVADAVAACLPVPLLHIADVAAAAIQAQGLSRVGLLGTCFTMERQFFRGRLQEKYGIEVLLPDEADRQYVHQTIYDEFAHGRFLPETRKRYVQIIEELAARGAGGVVLGCTEIPLLVSQNDTSVPLFDTTTLHAKAAVDFALS